ncbi:MAG: transcriptional regulator [Oligoflexia bacterium]|nr:MAG: transcriptional regulator [Oligoflexia bacterium]
MAKPEQVTKKIQTKDITKPLLQKCDDVSHVLKAISHPVRLKILCYLIQKEESTVGDLTDFCEISQSAMSQFLGRMKEEGLLEARREGQCMYYSVKDLNLIHLLKAIREIYC